MNALVLSMGGTIDAAPYPEGGQPPVNITPSDAHLSMSELKDIASTSDDKIQLDWIEICNKDSKEIGPSDMSLLEHSVITNASNYDRVLVTIGTDRMAEIARDLKERLGESTDCPVVFTGAIWPLANPSKSEGRENLELALLGNPEIPSGVYIAMHGLFAPCERLRKDQELRRFVYVAS